jgi:hypothetical protein
VRRTDGDTVQLLGLGDRQIIQHGWMKKHTYEGFNLDSRPWPSPPLEQHSVSRRHTQIYDLVSDCLIRATGRRSRAFLAWIPTERSVINGWAFKKSCSMRYPQRA